jgi:hypothetical protein
MSDGRSHVEGKERSGLQHMSALDGEFVAPLQDSPSMPLTAIPSVLFGRRMRSRSISCCLVLLTPPPPCVQVLIPLDNMNTSRWSYRS